MWEALIGGAGVLVALASGIGLLLDREGRAAAWSRISVARRVNAEQRRELEQLGLELDIRTDDLDTRERRLDLREMRHIEREGLLEALERDPGVRGEPRPVLPPVFATRAHRR